MVLRERYQLGIEFGLEVTSGSYIITVCDVIKNIKLIYTEMI